MIPARSGSKGIPDKNIQLLNGKPLIAYSIESAIQSRQFDTVHVSTDSEAYAEISCQYGAEVPFLRSPETATDAASSWEALLEVLLCYEKMGQHFDTVTLLQPTSPLRSAEDICAAYQVMADKNAKTVVSVCEAEHPPFWSNLLSADRCMDGFLDKAALAPRQALGKYFRVNGAIYLFNVNDFIVKGSITYDKHCYAYVMPVERSVDIDGPLDMLVAEVMMRDVRAGCFHREIAEL